MKQLVYDSKTILLVRTKDTRPATQIAKDGEQLYLKGFVPDTKDELHYTRRISSTPEGKTAPSTLRTLLQFQSDVDVATAPDVIKRQRATVNITVTTVNDELGKAQGKTLLKTAIAAAGADDCAEYDFTTTYSSLEQTDISAAAQSAVIAAM
jgi:hypothetical protein